MQENADQSQAALAEKVGAPAASVWRRVKALEEAGVLRRAVRLVDPQKVGRGVSVICQLRMRSHAVEERAKFEASGTIWFAWWCGTSPTTSGS